jgi:ArsR family transcriptional regulator
VLNRPDDVFRLLADETRLRCVLLLLAAGELCVCELTHALGITQPKMSRHLGVLREAGLVADRRQGHWVHYRLAPDLPQWLMDVVSAAAQAGERSEPFVVDRERLAHMAERPTAGGCG